MALEFIRGLFVGLLQRLGFVNKEATIVLIGLDNAGKTTLQYKLKTGQFQSFVPTQRAKEEEFRIGGVTVKAWDLGGHQSVRYLWKKYSVMADGIVFMMDSADRDRLSEARKELQSILTDPEFEHIPKVIMANKCDKKSVIPRSELQRELGIDDASDKLKLYMTSILNGVGYEEGFRWLSEQVS